VVTFKGKYRLRCSKWKVRKLIWHAEDAPKFSEGEGGDVVNRVYVSQPFDNRLAAFLCYVLHCCDIVWWNLAACDGKSGSACQQLLESLNGLQLSSGKRLLAPFAMCMLVCRCRFRQYLMLATAFRCFCAMGADTRRVPCNTTNFEAGLNQCTVVPHALLPFESIIRARIHFELERNCDG
jgi:hypothetical protein